VRLKASWTGLINLLYSETLLPPLTAKYRVVIFKEISLSKRQIAAGESWANETSMANRN